MGVAGRVGGYHLPGKYPEGIKAVLDGPPPRFSKYLNTRLYTRNNGSQKV
jgi:hypothetical protein